MSGVENAPRDPLDADGTIKRYAKGLHGGIQVSCIGAGTTATEAMLGGFPCNELIHMT